MTTTNETEAHTSPGLLAVLAAKANTSPDDTLGHILNIACGAMATVKEESE